jgi:hypothetical protein
MMSDIGDPAVSLMMNRRLIGASRLQIVDPDELHVGGLRGSADQLLLCVHAAAARAENGPNTRGQLETMAH